MPRSGRDGEAWAYGRPTPLAAGRPGARAL